MRRKGLRCSKKETYRYFLSDQGIIKIDFDSMGMLKFVFKNAVVLFLHLQLWNVFTVITVIKNHRIKAACCVLETSGQ